MRNKQVLALLLILCLVLCGCKQPAQSGEGEKVFYKVSFYSDDGILLLHDSVEAGASATPPQQPQVSNSVVFQSWDQDISCVTGDMEVHPICQSVEGSPNVFTVTGSYVKAGEKVTVPVQLRGQVCLAGFELLITYDAEKLELVSVLEDGGVVYNNETAGQLRLNYVSANNTVADVDICNLEFAPKTDAAQVSVSVQVDTIYACEDTVDSNNDALYVPEYSVINGTVFVLP